MVPGPDFIVVLRWSLVDLRHGLSAAMGTLCGLLVHAAAAVLGVSALLAAPTDAFGLVKLVGAVYLIALGVGALLRAIRTDASHAQGVQPGRASHPWRQAFLTNVLNPKAALFLVALLPQFLPAGIQTGRCTPRPIRSGRLVFKVPAMVAGF